jgi:hypothetical protein
VQVNVQTRRRFRLWMGAGVGGQEAGAGRKGRIYVQV